MRNTEVDTRRQRALAAALALALGGCATSQPQAEVTSAPTPVSPPCVDPAQIPAEPPTVGTRFNGDARHDLQVLAPNAKALRDWGQQMHAMLEACAAPAEGAPAAKP